jgi:hypothetical protein
MVPEIFGDAFKRIYGRNYNTENDSDEFKFCSRKYAKEKKLLDANLYQMDIKIDQFNSTNCDIVLNEVFKKIPNFLMWRTDSLYNLLRLNDEDREIAKQHFREQTNIDKVFKVYMLRGLTITDQQRDNELELFIEFFRVLLYSLDSFKPYKPIKV